MNNIQQTGVWTMRVLLVAGGIVGGLLDKGQLIAFCIVLMVASFIFFQHADE